MKAYKHIFFDLDRTLWDFDANAREAFEDIRHKHGLDTYIDNQTLIRTYKKYNEYLWDEYRYGRIDKDKLRIERFILTLKAIGIDDWNLALKISEDYLAIAPQKTNLLPGTLEALDYLNQRYHLHILTNGFEHTQQKKLNNSNIASYFSVVVTSESLPGKKPSPEFFHHALLQAGSEKAEAIMVGDDLDVDIVGARNAGIDQIYYNPSGTKHHENVTYEIIHLKELMTIL
jgi:putative hydrolase of the HAD superfamily